VFALILRFFRHRTTYGQTVAIDDYRLPHFDPLLQLRLLELNTDPVLQLVDGPLGFALPKKANRR
jgi:hypothetical protein